MWAELFKKLDIGQQLVLHVRMQFVVLGDEIIMKVNFYFTYLACTTITMP